MEHGEQQNRRKRRKLKIGRLAILTVGLTLLFNIISWMKSPSPTFHESSPVAKNVNLTNSVGVAKAAAAESKPVLTALPNGIALGKMLASIPQSQPTVYLTFDDGPSPALKEIVGILDKNNIQGSFFWVGEHVNEADVEFGKQMIQEGHVIGNHTMHHDSLKGKSLDQQIQLIEENANFISKKIGHPITYFRPPYGAVDQNTKLASQKVGEAMAYWQVDTEDWKYPHDPKKVLANIEKEVQPGSIILMHEKDTTAQMLPEIIKILKSKGYQFAPLPSPEEKKA